MTTIHNEDRFGILVQALETGWEIEEPVLLGAMWQDSALERSGVYHFVLRNIQKDSKKMISLPPSSPLLLFLSENRILVSQIP